MKKIFAFSAALIALASCGLKEEFQPVVTGKYENPAPAVFYTDSDFGKITTIADLAKTYKTSTPYVMKAGTVIKGRVSTTDQPGNFYKSFYLQDETGGIEIKVGKNALYNDYLEGQTVYVDCEDLSLGMYGYKTGNYGGMGMVQIGFSDASGSYETSYLESPLIIDSHVLRGDPSDIQKVTPYVITDATKLPNAKSDTQATNKYVGSLVTLKGLKYGNEVFVLLYLDSQKDKSSYTNRVFLSSSNCSDPTCGITTWAMSKSLMTEYLASGIWDECKIGSGNTYDTNPDGTTKTLGDLRSNGTYPTVEKAAYSVSQYFKMGTTEIQLRTSGFCKSCDYEIPESVRKGTATVDITGILTLYQGSYQLVVNSLDDIVVNE